MDRKNTDPIVVVAGLRKTYRRPSGDIEVLQGVDLVVSPGTWVALTGKSGCGKTTLLHLLGLLDEPDAGVIEYSGRAVKPMSSFQKAALRRSKIGFIFQSYYLLPELNALENVMLAGRIGGLPAKRAYARAEQLLSDIGMADRRQHRPAELSGGEQQRVAMARALMNDPAVILADEPTGNLDAANADAIMDILTRLRTEEGKTVIMATHSQALALKADKVYVLSAGVLREDTGDR